MTPSSFICLASNRMLPLGECEAPSSNRPSTCNKDLKVRATDRMEKVNNMGKGDTVLKICGDHGSNFHSRKIHWVTLG